jgi:uncharacterized RDD family membrane protein YckC
MPPGAVPCPVRGSLHGMDERRQAVGSWITGTRWTGVDSGYPGERLGLPKEGPGAVVGYGRRFLALCVDWFIAEIVALLLLPVLGYAQGAQSVVTLIVFGAMTWLLVGLAGTTGGKRLAGIRVARLDGRPVGLLRGLVRAVLLLALIPALIWDRDWRGLHDRAAGTVVVRR